MSKVTFGGEGILTLYKRINQADTISFTFKDSAGDPYIYPSNLFSFKVKKYIGDKKNIIFLDSSDLTLTSNVLDVPITASESNLNEGEYYYQLLYDGKVRLNGRFVLYNGSVDVAD